MDTRVQKLAEVIVNYSLKLKPGETALFRGTSPLAMPLLSALTEEALKIGAHPLTYTHISGEGAIITRNGTVEQIEQINPMLKMMYETAHAIVRVEAQENTSELANVPSEKLKALQRSRGGLISIQMKREADRTLRRCTTLFPTPAYAQDARMSMREYEDFVFGACMVEAPNPVGYWLDLAARQSRLVNYLKGKRRLHVRGENIDLSMSIEGRTFANADGTANMPDGEIFTGPVEDSVNGHVKFTFPLVNGGNRVQGAELVFKDGLVTEARATDNLKFLETMLDTDPGARRLGEFAIGTNTFIDRFTGQILFDEKIGGTVHMAIGQGYAETGSVNTSVVHWDMICDTRQHTEILVDGDLFFKDGKFLVD
jgi:aminopeptidase